MITPTVGRVILVKNRTVALVDAQPECGLVAYVHEDGKINIGGTNHYGLPFALTEVIIRQEGDAEPDGVYAEWMPYQVKVATGEIPPVLHATPDQSKAIESTKVIG